MGPRRAARPGGGAPPADAPGPPRRGGGRTAGAPRCPRAASSDCRGGESVVAAELPLDDRLLHRGQLTEGDDPPGGASHPPGRLVHHRRRNGAGLSVRAHRLGHEEDLLPDPEHVAAGGAAHGRPRLGDPRIVELVQRLAPLAADVHALEIRCMAQGWKIDHPRPWLDSRGCCFRSQQAAPLGGRGSGTSWRPGGPVRRRRSCRSRRSRRARRRLRSGASREQGWVTAHSWVSRSSPCRPWP